MRGHSDISLRIEMLRFILIVGIVFIHIHTADIEYSSTVSDGNIFAIITNFISEVLARVSVPLFFALSGYLFFLNFKPSFETFSRKFKSRFFTLFVTFVIWNLFIFIFFAIAQNNPITAKYFTGERPLVLELNGWIEYISLFFGFNGYQYPVAYQFWFIRDLIIMVLFTPLIYILLKRVGYLFLAIMFSTWFFELYHVIDPSSACFFSFGAFLAIKKYDFSLTDRYALKIFSIYIVMGLIAIFSDSFYVSQATIFVGVVAIFSISRYALLYPSLKDTLIDLSKYSFFLFAIHEPLLSIVRKLIFVLVSPSSDFSIFLIYLFAPIMTILLAIWLYKLIKSISPKVITISTGGRA